ncbi:MAG: hypothetical protein JKX85_15420 [Phycisphaeraceae bacterium]|nr:hypothetical protein [Phycisphaeraceae bacterium]
MSELRRLKQLGDENRKLKALVADWSLDKHILQDVLSKKNLKPAHRRKRVREVEGVASPQIRFFGIRVSGLEKPQPTIYPSAMA